jgi:hypothetical protein
MKKKRKKLQSEEKMQVDGKQEDKKETCHSTLVLEILFRYMFQEDYGVIEKRIVETQKK